MTEDGMIASYVASPDEQAILKYLQAMERMGYGWRWLGDQSWVTEFELRDAVHLQHYGSVRAAVTAGLVERVRIANRDHPSARMALLRLSESGRRVLATQGKLLERDVIPFRRADPPTDSFLIYGSVWAVLKYLQAHPGWHERGRLLEEAARQERSIRQPHANTATLLVRYGWAEQRESHASCRSNAESPVYIFDPSPTIRRGHLHLIEWCPPVTIDSRNRYIFRCTVSCSGGWFTAANILAEYRDPGCECLGCGKECKCITTCRTGYRQQS